MTFGGAALVKRTHTQGGFLFALMTSPFIVSTLGISNKVYACFLVIVYVYGSYFGSVLPDIDMKSSYISKKIPIVYKLFGKNFKHRGFTHSLIFLLILWGCASSLVGLSGGDYIVKLFFYGLLIGYISHIALDLFTSDGVYLFAPYNKIIKLANIKTNSKKEKRVQKFLELATLMALGANCYVIIII